MLLYILAFLSFTVLIEKKEDCATIISDPAGIIHEKIILKTFGFPACQFI